jgi:hypothetical protein
LPAVADIRIEGGQNIAAISKRLSAAGSGGLKKELRRTVVAAAKPLQADLRAAVMRLDSKAAGLGGGSRRRSQHRGAKSVTRRHGLRASIARSVKIKVRMTGATAGVRVYVDRKALPHSQRNLPAAMNDPGGWRHPVWGNRKAWVQQTGGPWWTSTVRQAGRRIAHQIDSDIRAWTRRNLG